MAKPQIRHPSRIAFGRQLCRLRKEKGILQATMAERFNVHVTVISKVETGARGCDAAFAAKADEFLDARGQLIELWNDLNQNGSSDAPAPAWFDWPEEEENATILTCYMLSVFAGLIQTPDYVTALLKTEKKIKKRLERQALLTRTDRPPPRVVLLIDELALTRPVGDREVLRGQLANLLEVAKLPNVTVQLILSSGEHAGNGSSFTIATMKDGSEIAHVESALRGFTTAEPEDIAVLRHTLIDIQRRALPEEMSLNEIRKVMNEL
ncbi:helix-turn-helix domain-containing protein [Actinomadura flavalba]|uniref:helix-turn-helix domain-containing protein n=1 Tax=Actinomadura flavalba TaxID=1120938 RepID=UPI0003637D0A|nr:helix-turn-helix transcriptional regulator [Actinomadura flavalba]